MGVITGRNAQLKVGHQLAATMVNWSLTFEYKVVGRLGIWVTGKATAVDPYWSRSNEPMDFWGQMDEQHWWVWQGVSLERPSAPGLLLQISGYGQPTVKLVPVQTRAYGQDRQVCSGGRA